MARGLFNMLVTITLHGGHWGLLGQMVAARRAGDGGVLVALSTEQLLKLLSVCR